MPDRPLLDRRRFIVAGLGAVLAACSGRAGGPATLGTGAPSSPGSSPTPIGGTATVAAPSPTPAPNETSSPSAARPSADLPTGIVPTRVEIPAIGVDAPCVQLNLTADEVEVPEDFDDTGWWVQTRQPGEIGPAVIGGHVDSRSGPAVFHRLRELQPGDEVTVRDDADEARTFVVDRAPIQVDKHDRPPEVLGFGQARPELRLITCGGDFNPSIGHYTDNIVLFCHDPSFDA